MSNEILGEFLEDSREHLQAAGQHLLALEKDQNQPEELNGLLRRLHTIKGNSGFLDLNQLYRLLHRSENVLQILREQQRPTWPAASVDLYLRVLDTAEIMIGQIENHGSDEVAWLENLINDLDRLEQFLNDSPPESHPASQASPPRPEPPPEPELFPDPELFPEPDLSSESEPGAAPVAHSSLLTVPQIRGWIQDLLGCLDDASSENQPDPFCGEIQGRMVEVETALTRTAGPNARQAWALISEFLFLTEKELSNPDQNATRRFLSFLLQNLAAWLDQEARPVPSPIAPPRVERDAQSSEPVLRLEAHDLSDDGRQARPRIEALIAEGAQGLVFDLRAFTALRSREIGTLITLIKMVPRQERVGLRLKSEAQSGLMRVFRVMGLDRIYALYQDQD